MRGDGRGRGGDASRPGCLCVLQLALTESVGLCLSGQQHAWRSGTTSLSSALWVALGEDASPAGSFVACRLERVGLVPHD